MVVVLLFIVIVKKGHRQRSDPLGRQRRNDEGNALSDRFFTQRGEDLSGCSVWKRVATRDLTAWLPTGVLKERVYTSAK